MSTREIAAGALFTAFACIAAITLRFGGAAFVPFSLLPLVVFLAGFVLPPKPACLSLLAYVLLGLAGIPVFAKAPFGGPAYVLQPTFGFILSFPLAAGLISLIRGREINAVRWLSAALTGIVFIYVLGAAYLYIVVNYYLGSPMPVNNVVRVAILPFIGFDILKAIGAAWLAKSIVQRLPGFEPKGN